MHLPNPSATGMMWQKVSYFKQGKNGWNSEFTFS